MTPTVFMQILQETLYMIILLSAPILGASLSVGMGISVFQAVTQIQESTLTFVPKILISFAVLIATGPWMVEMMMTHTSRLFEMLITLGNPTAQ